MKHTLKAKYAADGLTAHRQRISHQPAVVKAMKNKATLAKITARLKSDGGRPQLDMANVRASALASLSQWYADHFDKAMIKAMSGMRAVARPRNLTTAELTAQIKGGSADVMVFDDVGIGGDDKLDALAFLPETFRKFGMGMDVAKPNTKDFGVIMVNASC